MDKRIFLLLILAGALLLGTAALAAGQTAIDWDVISGGGGTGGSGLVEISDTVGQPVIGLAQANGVAIASGFWSNGEGDATPTATPTTPPNPTDTPTLTPTGVPPLHGLYLPLVRR